MEQIELESLLSELTKLEAETEWVEFKHNNEDPQEIGENISAISNAATLHRKKEGYIVWGIENNTHRVVGTKFQPRLSQKGNEELESWLCRLLKPRIDFRIHTFKYDGQDIVLIIVPAAFYVPIAFSGTEYIRIGSTKQKLRDYPEKEKALWASFQRKTFADEFAVRGVSSEEVLSLINYPELFNLLGHKLPDQRQGILKRLASEKVIHRSGNDRYDISNLGAVLFASNLDEFQSLSRKAVRVILYRGSDRTQPIKEQVGSKGYAVGFKGLVNYVNLLLPSNEKIDKALRSDVRVYPEIAIRELVANALIHQDFTITGTGPMVEIFVDRIEITNPGKPLIDTLRFIDEPPISRNDVLAAFMRRMNICEERGSGIDKVIKSIELFQLPAPDFQVTQNHTKAILHAPKPLSKMSGPDKIRACYQHACLCWVSNTDMTNSSLRERLGILGKNYAVASRVIREAIRANMIKPADPTNKSRKHAKYVPFWL